MNNKKDKTEQLVYFTTKELFNMPGSFNNNVMDASPQLAKLIASKGLDAERFIRNGHIRLYKINDELWYAREQ